MPIQIHGKHLTLSIHRYTIHLCTVEILKIGILGVETGALLKQDIEHIQEVLGQHLLENMNTGWLWRRQLAESSHKKKLFTTLMGTNLIIELKILLYFLRQSILVFMLSKKDWGLKIGLVSTAINTEVNSTRSKLIKLRNYFKKDILGNILQTKWNYHSQLYLNTK